MANPLSDLWKGIFGGSDISQQSILNQGQQNLFNTSVGLAQGALGGLYNNVQAGANAPISSYNALPDFEQQFQQQFGNPLQQRHEMDLAQNQNSGELFSGGTIANNYRANNQFQSSMAQARAGMMMQEREKQRLSMDTALQRQQNAQGLLNNMTQSPLGVKAVENKVEAAPSVLGAIGGIASGVQAIGAMA